MRRLLNELGFSYKKTKIVSGKADLVSQRDFIDYYNELKETKLSEDVIYFATAHILPIILKVVMLGLKWAKRSQF